MLPFEVHTGLLIVPLLCMLVWGAVLLLAKIIFGFAARHIRESPSSLQREQAMDDLEKSRGFVRRLIWPVPALIVICWAVAFTFTGWTTTSVDMGPANLEQKAPMLEQRAPSLEAESERVREEGRTLQEESTENLNEFREEFFKNREGDEG